MNALLQQFKARRLALGLKQNDMLLLIGVSRQQYQRLEARDNPRLDTMELIAKGLNSETALIPKERLSAVLAVLKADVTALTTEPSSGNVNSTALEKSKRGLADDPWEGLLGDEK